MNIKKSIVSLMSAFAVALTLGAAGCGGDDTGTDGPTVQRDLSGGLDFTVQDMAVPGADMAGQDLAMNPDLGFDPVKMCYPSPGDKHEEIINACTTAQKINKTPKAAYFDGGCCPALP